jgi:hypothetical protein
VASTQCSPARGRCGGALGWGRGCGPEPTALERIEAIKLGELDELADPLDTHRPWPAWCSQSTVRSSGWLGSALRGVLLDAAYPEPSRLAQLGNGLPVPGRRSSVAAMSRWRERMCLRYMRMPQTFV